MRKSAAAAWAIASTVALTGAMSHSVAAQEPMLTDTLWQLEEIVYNNDTMLVPDDPEAYSIQFFEDGTVAVRADCNVGNGVYDLDSTDLITLQAFTLAACGPDSIDDEFRQGLENAAILFFEDGDLLLDLFADAGTMRFSAAEESMAEAETEVETEVEMEEETVVEEEEPVETMPEPEEEPVRGLW